jgi:hypothetical protein
MNESPTGPFVVLIDGNKGETFLPHYYSTPCMHGLHDQCKGKCKFCEERCRCACHSAPPPIGGN